MERGDIGFVAGLAGFLLGGWAVFTSLSMKSDVESLRNERGSDQDNITGIGARVEGLDQSHKALTRRVDGLSSDPKVVREAIEHLQTRVKALEEGRAPPKLKDDEPKPAPDVNVEEKK